MTDTQQAWHWFLVVAGHMHCEHHSKGRDSFHFHAQNDADSLHSSPDMTTEGKEKYF